MSDDALGQVSDARIAARRWEDSRREAEVAEMALRTTGMAMQQAGFIPLQSDPEWVAVSIEEVSTEGLHLSRH